MFKWPSLQSMMVSHLYPFQVSQCHFKEFFTYYDYVILQSNVSFPIRKESEMYIIFWWFFLNSKHSKSELGIYSILQHTV